MQRREEVATRPVALKLKKRLDTQSTFQVVTLPDTAAGPNQAGRPGDHASR